MEKLALLAAPAQVRNKALAAGQIATDPDVPFFGQIASSPRRGVQSKHACLILGCRKCWNVGMHW